MRYATKLLQRLTLISVMLWSVAAAGNAVPNPDPWEAFNRPVYRFNRVIDRGLFKPVAKAYRNWVPDAVQHGLGHFIAHLDDVTCIMNDLLQADFPRAGRDAARVLVNSTVGFLGLVDMAASLGVSKQPNDFGITLAHWGYQQSAYWVLPLLGPSTVRDGFGSLVNTWMTPYPYLQPESHRYLALALKFTVARAEWLSHEDLITVAALDEYQFVRDAYLQKRRFEIQGDDFVAGDEADFDDTDSDETDFDEAPWVAN